MQARSGTLYSHSGRFDHVLERLRDTVTPAAQREAGFSGMLVMDNAEALGSSALPRTTARPKCSERGRQVPARQVSRVITHMRTKSPPAQTAVRE
jgi:hypothetical protein